MASLELSGRGRGQGSPGSGAINDAEETGDLDTVPLSLCRVVVDLCHDRVRHMIHKPVFDHVIIVAIFINCVLLGIARIVK